MNSIKTTPRGFPFDLETMKELQDLTVPPINALAKLIPDNSRVWGVEKTLDNQVTDGFIIWDGELLPFVGGANNAQFSIIEEVIERTFNIGTVEDPQLEDHDAYVHRYAQIGDIGGAESTHTLAALKPAPRFLTYLKKGVVFFGTAVPSYSDQLGTIIDVTFDSVGTANYMPFVSFYSSDEAQQQDFDYDVYGKTATGFKVRLRNIGDPIEAMFLQYLLIPSNNELAVLGP